MGLRAADAVDCITLRAGPSSGIAEREVGEDSVWVYFLMCDCITPNGWGCYASSFYFFIGL